MDNSWLAVLLGLFGGGGLATIIVALLSRHKSKGEIAHMAAETEQKEAETTEIITRAAGAVSAMMDAQLKILRQENETMRCEIDKLRDENSTLKKVQGEHEVKLKELLAIAEQYDVVLTGAHTLYEQVVELNGQPKYKPPKRRDVV